MKNGDETAHVGSPRVREQVHDRVHDGHRTLMPSVRTASVFLHPNGRRTPLTPTQSMEIGTFAGVFCMSFIRPSIPHRYEKRRIGSLSDSAGNTVD